MTTRIPRLLPGALLTALALACAPAAVDDVSPGGGDGSDGGGVDAGDTAECGTEIRAFASVPASGRVVPLYLVASDTPEAEAESRRAVFERALAAIQRWYGEAMRDEGGLTFRFDPVRVFASRFTRAEWTDWGANGFEPPGGFRREGCGMWYAAEWELGEGGVLERAELEPVGTEGVYYLVVGGGGWGGGCGAGGLAAVEEMLLDRVEHRCPNGRNDACARRCGEPGGLAATDPWCREWPHDEPGYGCTAVGAFAHEIGHGFGLPHAEDRATSTGRSIMDAWWEYDRGVTLSREDRADLAASGYFAAPQD